ncbi:MAG TPA: hypothetical protein ENI53_00240 [Thermoplasmatales archaeon]|nr:hypothetical protein [Thermoplasmatales archaeon]
MKIVIIGCGAGGGTSAQFARKVNREAEIILYDREGYGQYSKCALPFIISGKNWEDIVEFSPSWFKKNGIKYRNEEVYKINFDGGTVEGEKEEEFDVLIVASGADPYSPFVAENVYFFRTLKDAIEVKNIALKSEKAVVVGAGLIGLEVAEALFSVGINVTVLEYMPYILPSMLDKDMADYLMKKLPLKIILNCKVEKAEDKKVFADEEYEADFVIIATGNKPNSFDEEAIKVDEKCKAFENIYACGDCTQIRDFFGRYINVGLGSVSARQGRVAGINAGGGNEIMIPPVFSKTTKLFDIEVASTGLLSHEVDAICAKYTGKDLPHYMNGEEIVVKIVADKNGKIVGCQAIGRGASKIIDRITLAIYNEMNVGQISRIENAYAPAVAPTFDAVEIACRMIERKLKR